MKKVILPKESFEEVQDDLKDVNHGVELVYVSHMDEVLKEAFPENIFKKAKKAAKVKAQKKKTTKK